MTKLVWERFREGGNVKLALLCLADYAGVDGVCWPSISAIARRLVCSERQAQRTVHELLDTGVVEVIGNAKGGGQGASRRYRILIDRLTTSAECTPTGDTGVTPNPDASVTPDAAGKGDTGDARGCHGCRVTGDTGVTRTVIEPSRTVKRPSRKKLEQTLKTFLETCDREKIEPIPASDPVWDYAEKIGLPEKLLELCWKEFKARHLGERKAKRQKDWPATFRNCVKSNWYRLWYIADDDSYRATTVGKMSDKAHAAR